MTSRTELRSQISHFLYAKNSSTGIAELIQRQKNILNQYLDQHDLREKREQQNLPEKEQFKLVTRNYAEGFKLSQKTSDPEVLYRDADYLLHIGSFSLNTSAFLKTIQLLGTKQQSEKWRHEVLNGKIIGAYGQTELAHGSNVQGLETEAHYDEKSKTWRINSPKTTSAKYWPGILGLGATHAVVQAKTFVKGKPIGIQTFVVEFRDQNLKNMEGVRAGDLGPKLGFLRVDNGFLHMKNLSTPRANMLMKYIEVTEEGQVKGLENKTAIKYGYGSMLNLRVQLTTNFCVGYMLFALIENQLLAEAMGRANEQLHRKTTIENMGIMFGIVTANEYTKGIFDKFMKQIAEKNYPEADKHLARCHILSATLKAVSSWKSMKMLKQIITSNPYATFHASRISKSFADCVPTCTYEGDNSVLLQQTGKFLIMLPSGDEPAKPNSKIKDDDLVSLSKALAYVTFKEVERLKSVFEKEFDNGGQMKTIWNEKHQRDIIETSKLWGSMMLTKGYLATLSTLTENKEFFIKIGKLFGKKLIEETPQIYFYGFEIESVDSWKNITEDEYWAMTHILPPASQKPIEEHKIHSRQGDWLKARL